MAGVNLLQLVTSVHFKEKLGKIKLITDLVNRYVLDAYDMPGTMLRITAFKSTRKI